MKQYLDMLWVITMTDFKRRYQGSLVGFVWAMLKPVALFVILYGVFSHLLGQFGLEYAMQLLVTLLFWLFFSEATLLGLTSLFAKTPMLTKMKFPRELVPVGAVLSSFLGFMCMLGLGLVVFVSFGFLAITGFIAVMLMSVMMFMIVLGVSLWLAPLFVKYRHVHQLWDLILLVGFYVHPILYSLQDLPPKMESWVSSNPLVWVFESLRVLVAGGTVEMTTWLQILLFAVLLLISGLVLFGKLIDSVVEDL